MRIACFAILSLVLSNSSAHAQDWAEEAGRLLDRGETGEAISLLEKQAKKDPEDARVWRWLGDAYTALARDWADQGSGFQAPLSDARNAYERALTKEPMNRAALEGAHDACYELGLLDQAASYALRDMALALLVDGQASAWHLERVARDRALAWRSVPPAAPEPFARSLQETVAIVRSCRKSAPEDPALAIIETELLQQAGLVGPSASVLEDALRATPSAGELHQKLVDLCYRQDIVDRLLDVEKRLAEQHPGDAIICWYRGYAALLEGDIMQRERRFEEAIRFYRDCDEWMARSRSLEPDYTDGSARIAVLARSGVGWCHLQRGETAKARESFVLLLREAPEHRDLRDGMHRTYIDGIGRLGAEYESGQDFADGAALAREVVELEPDSAYWWNNLGFFLREYGSQIAAGMAPAEGDREEAARKVFEQSWQAYLEASARAPEDVRIINDTALIQIYHLQADLAGAEAMLEKAVELGRSQLADLGDEAPDEQRYPIAQALGDAYQNLGYLYYHLRHDPKAARPFYEKAIEVDPVARDALRRTLQAIDRNEPERPRRAAGPARSASRRPASDSTPPARGYVSWERDLDRALERARRENRPILVYKVSGLSLLSPFLENLVRQERFARAAAGTVCLVADPNRHDAIDRRRDGKRLLSTRYGTVTSGEHTAVSAALDEWWSQHRGPDDPESLAEGFHLFSPDGKRLDIPWHGDPEAFFQAAEEAVGKSVPPPDLDRITANLLGPDPREARAAAGVLATYPWARAGDRLEALLFDDATPTEPRTALVEALSQAGDPGSRALLAALVSQRDDPALSRMALDRLPAGSDTQAPRFALDWSPDPGVRRVALRALVRLDPGPETRRLLVARMAAGDETARAQAAAEARPIALEIEDALLSILEHERSARVRAGICRALGQAGDAAVATLERLRDEDPDTSVRAAARRALEDH